MTAEQGPAGQAAARAVPDEPGAGLDWDFGGMAHRETLEHWLDRVHPLTYDTEDGPFARCPTCEEWSPCDVRKSIGALLDALADETARAQTWEAGARDATRTAAEAIAARKAAGVDRDRLTDWLHTRNMHPDYEYAMTKGPRKQWDDADEPPAGDGWERNITSADHDGWERFDYHEESYWRRRHNDE